MGLKNLFRKPLVQAANIQGLGSRGKQEDSFGISDIHGRAVLAVLADGMGGIDSGEKISAMAVNTLLDGFSLFKGKNPGVLLWEGALAAQENARAFIEEAGGGLSGATLVAALVQDGVLWYVSLGDSRIYLLRKGELARLNRPHNRAAELDEALAQGEIDYETAKQAQDRAGLTQYIGMPNKMNIDRNIHSLPLEKGDRIMLMSDGVFETLSEAELIQAQENKDVYQAAETIEAAVLAKLKPYQDNFTAILMEVLK